MPDATERYKLTHNPYGNTRAAIVLIKPGAFSQQRARYDPYVLIHD